MSKRVTFRMYWECSGLQTIDLPDSIDATNRDAVKKYVQSMWRNVPIPDGEYIPCTEDMDYDAPFTVSDGDVSLEVCSWLR